MIEVKLWKKYKEWVDSENERIRSENKKRIDEHNKKVLDRNRMRANEDLRRDLEWSQQGFFTKVLYGFKRPYQFRTFDLRPSPYQEEQIKTSIAGYYDWVVENQ